jgi:hypothetical protein
MKRKEASPPRGGEEGDGRRKQLSALASLDALFTSSAAGGGGVAPAAAAPAPAPQLGQKRKRPQGGPAPGPASAPRAAAAVASLPAAAAVAAAQQQVGSIAAAAAVEGFVTAALSKHLRAGVTAEHAISSKLENKFVQLDNPKPDFSLAKAREKQKEVGGCGSRLPARPPARPRPPPARRTAAAHLPVRLSTATP